MVKKKEKEVKVYVCPSCRSHEVGFVFKLKNLFGVIPRMQCKKCGFESVSFPMWVIDKNKLDKANKKKINKSKRSKKKSKKRKSKKGGKK